MLIRLSEELNIANSVWLAVDIYELKYAADMLAQRGGKHSKSNIQTNIQ
jgi:hypothetical protein